MANQRVTGAAVLLSAGVVVYAVCSSWPLACLLLCAVLHAARRNVLSISDKQLQPGASSCSRKCDASNGDVTPYVALLADL